MTDSTPSTPQDGTSAEPAEPQASESAPDTPTADTEAQASTAPAAPAPMTAPAPMAAAAPAAAAKRRFPWIPVLVSLLVLQLIGSGVLAVLLVLTSARLVELDENLTSHEAVIAEQQSEIESLDSESSQLRSDLSTAETQVEIALDYATAYETCLFYLFEAIDAWENDDDDLGDEMYDEAWAPDGPCRIAADYLYGQ